MNPPDISGVLRTLVGVTVDHLMASRPLNLLLQRLVDRNGLMVNGPVEVIKRCQAVIERDPDGNVAGIHLQMHSNDVVSTGTFLGELVSGRHWDDAFDAPFTTAERVLVTVRRDKQSGWLTIHFEELNQLLGRVGELRRA